MVSKQTAKPRWQRWGGAADLGSQRRDAAQLFLVALRQEEEQRSQEREDCAGPQLLLLHASCGASTAPLASGVTRATMPLANTPMSPSKATVDRGNNSGREGAVVGPQPRPSVPVSRLTTSPTNTTVVELWALYHM